MKHTPTPWVWMADGIGPEDEYGFKSQGLVNPLQFKSQGYGFNPELIGANGETVISAGGGEYTPYYNREDAVFIAKACNLHDELVAALRNFLDLCPRMSDDDPIAPALADACREARAAIAKVQG